jgi:hypothetical protein
VTGQSGQTGEDRCRFFDREGVMLEEAAGDIEQHLATCAFCQEDRRKVAAVREELRRIPLPDDQGHWEQAVFAGIATREAAQRRRRRLFVVMPFLAVAVFAIFLWRRPGAERQGAGPLLAIRYQRGAVQMRAGEHPTKGATMVVSASGLDGRYRELRIYRDGAGLVLQCSDQAPCMPQATGLLARWTIPAEGTYRLVVISSTAPPPPTAAGYEADVIALRRAGGTLLEELVEVY